MATADIRTKLIDLNYSIMPHLDRVMLRSDSSSIGSELARRVDDLEVLADQAMLEGLRPSEWPLSTSLQVIRCARSPADTSERLPRPWEEAERLGFDVHHGGEGFVLRDDDGDTLVEVSSPMGLSVGTWDAVTVIRVEGSGEPRRHADFGSALHDIIESGCLTRFWDTQRNPSWRKRAISDQDAIAIIGFICDVLHAEEDPGVPVEVIYVRRGWERGAARSALMSDGSWRLMFGPAGSELELEGSIIHEWAHMLTKSGHDDDWGMCHARLYRAVYEPR